MIIIFRSEDPARRSGGVLLSVRAAAQGAPGGKFPYFRLRPAENGRSPLNHAAAARSPCTKPYNRPKIMQNHAKLLIFRARAAPPPATTPLPDPRARKPLPRKGFSPSGLPEFRRRATKPLPGNAAVPCAARKINFPKGIR